MAVSLPRFEDYFTPLATPQAAPAAEPVGPQQPTYDDLSPTQKAWVDKQIELQAKPRSALGEIGAGLVRGATVGLPKLVGQALQYAGATGVGTSLVEGAKAREAANPEDVNPEAHGGLVKALTGGAEMVAPTLGAMAAVPALAALGAPAGVAAGVGGAAGGIVFGAQAAQEAYERALSAGKTPDEAKSIARQEGLLTAGVQTVGVGVGGRFVSGAERAIPRILGKTYTVPEALSGLRDPEFVKGFAREFATNTGVQTTAAMTQAAGTAAIEQNAGIGTTTPWDAATSSIGPMLALSGILAPIGAATRYVHQQRNASLVKIAEDPNSTPLQVQAATRELQPMLEPLVGKDAASEWRLQSLEAANQNAAEKAQRAEAQAREGQLALPPPATMLPSGTLARTDTTAGETPDTTAADEHAATIYAARDAYETEQQRLAAAREVIANPPEGALTFSDFTTMAQKRRATGLAAGGKITESGLHDAYLRYVNDFNSRKEEPTPEQPAQAELDLGHPNKPPTNVDEGRTVEPMTAMEQAMKAAQEKKTAAEKEKAFAQAHIDNEQQKQADLQKLNTVGQAGKLADAALAGKINGNTPIAHSDLMAAWERASTEAGMDTSVLRGQARKKIELAIKSAEGKPIFMQQLNALRSARDDMRDGTVSRDTMDALVSKLEGKPNAAAEGVIPTGSVDEHQGNDKGGAPAESGGGGVPAERGPVEGSRPAEAPANEGRKAEVAAPVNAAPAAEVAKSPPPVETKAVGAAPQVRELKEVVVHPTGESVPYGDFSKTVPSGPISYETPGFQSMRKQDIARGKAARVGPTVPEADQRQAAPEYKFYFEVHHYDPREPRGSAGNRAWVMDYMKAKDIAAGVPTGAHITPMLASEKVDAVKQRESAVAALQWLKEYSPQDAELADGRAQQLERIYDVNANAREIANKVNSDLLEQYATAYRRNQALRKGVSPDKVVMDKAAMDEITRLARLDPGFEYAQSQMPNYAYSSALDAVVRGGDLSKALIHITDNSASEWMHDIADRLFKVGLNTKIVSSDAVAYNTRGEQIFGSYNHNTNTITIYHGGANAHTIVHETTHAATVGKLAEAEAAMLKPLDERTAADKAAIASLEDLRALMSEMKGRTPEEFRHAFKNEQEFVAEVMSNEKFRGWLDGEEYDTRSAMRKFVDWVRELFGFDHSDMNALNRAVSLTDAFTGDSRFANSEGMTYDQAASGAAAKANSTGKTLISKLEELSANSTALGTLLEKARAFMWQGSTTFNIAKWVDKIPSLRTLVPGMHAYMHADDIKGIMRQTKQLEFSNVVTTPVTLALSKLPKAQRDAMNAKLMSFAEDSTRHGYDYTKTFDENKRANPKLDVTNKGYFTQRGAEYRALPAAFRKPFEESFRVLRKDYIQRSAQMLRDTLRIYADKSPQLQKFIDALDIAHPALSEGKNPRPDFFYDPYSANLDKLVRKTIDDAKTVQTEKGHLNASIHEIEEYYKAAVENPYMHLGRSGEHFLSFKVGPRAEDWKAVQDALASYNKVLNLPNKERTVMLRFENPSQREAAHRAVAALPRSVSEARAGSLYESDSMNRMQGVPQFVHNLMRRIDDDPEFAGDDKAAMRAYLKRAYIDALPDSSAQKALAARKGATGVPGADADFLRNFSKRATGMASHIANAYAMEHYDKAFRSMKDSIDELRGQGPEGGNKAALANEVMKEMGQRFANSMTQVPSPIIDAVKAFGFNYFLAFSPSFWLTNLVQPYHLTLPYIGGRYGFVATAKEMGLSTSKSLKLVKAAIETGWQNGQEVGGMHGAIRGVLDLALPIEKSGLSAQEQAFVRKLIDSGQLDTTQGHELGRLASGVDTRRMIATKMLSAGSHYTEVVNRLTAGLTAYNLALRKGQGEEAASGYGIDAVRATQFNYSDNNTARALGRHGLAGKVTPLLASFQQYSFQTMELLIRLAADAVSPHSSKEERMAGIKGLAGVLTTTSIIAGTLGLPMATAISALVDRLLGDSNDPTDSKTAYRGWLADVFGKDVGEAIAHGIPRAVLGFDTSGRMGLQDVIPGSRFFADRRDLKNKMESGSFNLLGPAVSAGTSSAIGLGKIMDGQVMDGLIDMLPLALKGPVKAVKMQEQGYTTSQGNKLPIDVTPWATVAQAAGFTPSVKAEQSEVNFAFQQRAGLLKQQKALLSQKYYRAVENGEDTTQELQDVMQFNAQNPAFRIDISHGIALRSKQRAIAGATEADIPTLPRYLPQLDRYSFANVK